MRLTILILLLTTFTVQAQDFKKLVWSDEFNYDGLPDSKKWSYEEGRLRNNEAQYYTKADKDNAYVSNGVLTLEARKEKMGDASYTSASINTAKTFPFTYGRVEVRAKIPVGRGTWPAIWTLGSNIDKVDWPACGELDILENVGYDSLKIHANIHTAAYNHVKKTNKGNTIAVNNPWEDFHIYAIEWRADRIDFYYDKQLYFSYSKEANATDAEWPYNKPQYLMMNLAIGGDWGGQKGIYDAKFPHKFQIDYVRIYQ